MVEHPVCGTCFYYVGDSIDGSCRRYPPDIKQTGTYYTFVRVPEHYWCGEWKPLHSNK
jgi:hypothetical protein